jgi:hypothetical protein
MSARSRSTLDTFSKKLAGEGEPAALSCPSGVWLVRFERIIGRGAVVSGQKRSNYYVPCGRRRCEVCAPDWKRYHLARAFSGTNGVPMELLRFWTLTPPAVVNDYSEYNRTVCARFRLVWRQMGRRYSCLAGRGPEVVAGMGGTAYYGTKEFFRDGLIHLHVLIRQVAPDLLPRSDFGSGEWLQNNLAAHGFGPIHSWREVDAVKGGAPGAVSYVTKYALKSVQDEQFPKGARVDFWSNNWSIEWRQHQRMPTEMRLPDGSTKIVTYALLLPGEALFSKGRARRRREAEREPMPPDEGRARMRPR